MLKKEKYIYLKITVRAHINICSEIKADTSGQTGAKARL
jgi:hypothetical protein